MSSNKIVPLSIDLGNLAVFDPSPITDINEESLIENCRVSVNRLINDLLNLPALDSLESLANKEIPEPTTKLPRSLPLPKSKPLSRWQEFAKKRGIQKHKNGGKKYDERSEEWMSTHGKKSAKNVHKREDAWIKEWKDDEME